MWQGGSFVGGYPVMGANYKLVKATRLSLELSLGVPILPGLFALHHCDNPPCVNPLHLYGGTHMANMEDQRGRGRNMYASRTHCKNGHEYTSENTYWRPDGKGRHCRKCSSEYARRYKREHRVG